MVQAGLVIFMIYLPIFAVLLFIAVKKYKGYSFTSLWFSNLGDTRFPSSAVFNTSLFIYGLLSLFFAYNLSQILPNFITAQIGTVFLYVCSIATILTGLVSMNKNLKVHHIFSNTVFISITTFSLFLIHPLFILDVVPKSLLIGNALIVLVSLVVFVSFARLVAKLGKIPETLFDMRKKEKSFLIRNVAVWEWIFVFFVVIWNFAMSLVILQNLYV